MILKNGYDRILLQGSIFLGLSDLQKVKGGIMSQTMLDYIRKIPDYMKKQMKAREPGWKDLADCFCLEKRRSVTIIASGSSFHAAGCALYDLQRLLEAPVYIETPFSFVHYGRVDPNSFYLAISQSGRSRNTLQATQYLTENGVSVSFLTDNEEIVRTERLWIHPLHIGGEKIPFVTKGFSATVLFLLGFGHEISRRRGKEKTAWIDEERFSQAFMRQMEKAAVFFEENRDKLLKMKRIHICGGGPCRYVAAEAALKFCETLQMSATGYEIEEFLHGGNFELRKEHTVFLIDSSDAVHDRACQLFENLPILCDSVYWQDRVENMDEGAASVLYACFFQTLVYQINRAMGNRIPVMKPEYLKFEEEMKAKTMNYYR